jgi:hypothetical protein
MFDRMLSAFTHRTQDAQLRDLAIRAVRLAPWLVFGPITGVMSEAAFSAFRRGRPVIGALYLILNVAILVGMPVLTATILASTKVVS